MKQGSTKFAKKDTKSAMMYIRKKGLGIFSASKTKRSHLLPADQSLQATERHGYDYGEADIQKRKV